MAKITTTAELHAMSMTAAVAEMAAGNVSMELFAAYMAEREAKAVAAVPTVEPIALHWRTSDGKRYALNADPKSRGAKLAIQLPENCGALYVFRDAIDYLFDKQDTIKAFMAKHAHELAGASHANVELILTPDEVAFDAQQKAAKEAKAAKRAKKALIS